ncbi:VOC family protein [Actinosynnema sp. NPDC050801]|uniref:VOC family protein n=1 Tax=unclassified Actinosynnema TaxID=2637065 RepID=UPI0033E58D87
MELSSGAGLSGLVLGSTDPKRLGAWYQAAFAPEADLADSVLWLEQGVLVFEERDDVAERSAEPGRVIINIQVSDLAALVTHLNGLGDVTWIRPVEEIQIGLIATVKDVDGNFVNVWQPKG